MAELETIDLPPAYRVAAVATGGKDLDLGHDKEGLVAMTGKAHYRGSHTNGRTY